MVNIKMKHHLVHAIFQIQGFLERVKMVHHNIHSMLDVVILKAIYALVRKKIDKKKNIKITQLSYDLD